MGRVTARAGAPSRSRPFWKLPPTVHTTQRRDRKVALRGGC